jgi:DNA-binding winged helix-turn-helix (wHTH) protein/predicted ATPase
MIQFGRFQLDPAQGLRRGTQEVRLTPKSLALLCVLAERAGDVVSKEELFRTVWPGTAVSDAALTSCIQELRYALADDPRRPRFIETLHRRGYRFVARTSPLSGGERRAMPLSAPPDVPLVGRDRVIDQMIASLALAERGSRRVLFVSGEPGIGKTTVVQAFLARGDVQSGVRVTWGQCVQHYGVGEPYRPLLDALTRLCRQPGGDRVIAQLERCSPTWLAQLPALLAPARLARLRRAAVGTTRARMLRELVDALETLTADQPLILWLEDLHWGDLSTLDWIAAFAQRPELARLLLVGTFRAPPAIEVDHPLFAVVERLRSTGFCQEIALEGLEEEAVVDYVMLRFPAAPGQAATLDRLARLVHERTGGTPLFVVNVLDDLMGRGLLIPQGQGWQLGPDLNALDLGIPESIRRTIERQVDRLDPDERALLETASVIGATFSAVAVADASGQVQTDVEAKLAGLGRHRRFIREAGAVEWPDGTIAGRFEFVHVLYCDVLYQRVPAGRRAALHRLIGMRAEAAYGQRAPEIAAELAMHFERSLDLRRAVTYRQRAAENAQRRSAFQESRTHFERALALLELEPPSRERTEREVVCRIGLGAATAPTRGWGAPEVEATYLRARQLCQGLGETPQLFPALWGLWVFYWGRGPLDNADEIARELMGLARRSAEPAHMVQAHHAWWPTAFLQGDFQGVLVHAKRGIELYRADRDAAMVATYGGHDAAVCARNFLGPALALVGRLDEAVRASHEAIALARDLDHPFSLALAHVFAAIADQARRDSAETRTHAHTAATIAREQDFRLMLAWAAPLEGWAAVDQGQDAEGLEVIGHGLDDARATGSNSLLTYVLGLCADAYLKVGRVADGLQAVEEALAVSRSTGERFWLAELYRLHGELQLHLGSRTAARDAEAAFREAIDVARAQGAQLLRLRAMVSLARLCRKLGRSTEARHLLMQEPPEITGAAALPDLIEANALTAETC